MPVIVPTRAQQRADAGCGPLVTPSSTSALAYGILWHSAREPLTDFSCSDRLPPAGRHPPSLVAYHIVTAGQTLLGNTQGDETFVYSGNSKPD